MFRSPWIAVAIWIACAIGFAVVYLYLGRRRFYRTNAAGVEEFESYRGAVLSHLFEVFMRLIAGILFIASWVALFVFMKTPYKYGSMRSPVETTRCRGMAPGAELWNAGRVFLPMDC